MDSEEPRVIKSPIGDLWRVTHGNKTMIMNQKNVESYLESYKNEKQKRSEGLFKVC